VDVVNPTALATCLAFALLTVPCANAAYCSDPNDCPLHSGKIYLYLQPYLDCVSCGLPNLEAVQMAHELRVGLP
jgi:hypothetical protein